MTKSLEKRQKELDAFVKTLEGKTQEELEKMEQEVIKEADKNDEKVNKASFDMPKENYEVVAKAIRGFLNKQSVQWQYTLGMVGMYDFWDPDNFSKKIPYPQLDAILRMLGELQYTGYEEWAAVVAINKYFEPLRKGYTDILSVTYDIASRHDAIINALEKLKPIGEVEKK